MTAVMEVRNLSKTFPAERRHATLFSLLKRRLVPQMSAAAARFHALREISFQVEAGEMIGLIGGNGSGKTTLLKVLAGLYRPDEGEVVVRGELMLMAGLGLGMVDDLSVEENLVFYGAMYGIDRAHMKEELPALLRWAELEEFESAKLKTLSSGMKSRLAFSAVRLIKADIYLLDETLSAGDKNFRSKCMEVFENFRARGQTLMVATHDLEFVKKFCRRALWLSRGRQMVLGPAEQVVQQYNASTAR